MTVREREPVTIAGRRLVQLALQRQRPRQPERAGHAGILTPVDEDVLAMRRRIVVAQGGLEVRAGGVERPHVEERRAVPVVGLHA